MDLFTGASMISWCLLLITGWISFFVPNKKFLDKKILVVWIMEYHNLSGFERNSFNIYYGLFYFIFIITLIFTTAAFVVIVYNLFFKKNENVQKGMFDNISKFHFIPLICISILFIIGESLKKFKSFELIYYVGIYFDIKKSHVIFNLIFDIVGLGSLIFIYMKTTISEPLYASFIIKSAYSCFIPLLVYNFFYGITMYKALVDLKDLDEDLYDWIKGCGWAFSIFIGLINISLSVFLKDFILGIINFFMYIGMITYFFKISKDNIDKIYDNKGIGVIQILMMLLGLASTAFIVIKYKLKNE